MTWDQICNPQIREWALPTYYYAKEDTERVSPLPRLLSDVVYCKISGSDIRVVYYEICAGKGDGKDGDSSVT